MFIAVGKAGVHGSPKGDTDADASGRTPILRHSCRRSEEEGSAGLRKVEGITGNARCNHFRPTSGDHDRIASRCPRSSPARVHAFWSDHTRKSVRATDATPPIWPPYANGWPFKIATTRTVSSDNRRSAKMSSQIERVRRALLVRLYPWIIGPGGNTRTRIAGSKIARLRLNPRHPTPPHASPQGEGLPRLARLL